MNKNHLEELGLEWSADAEGDFADSQTEMDILGKLQPTKNLKKLSIYRYRGTRFPEWIGDPSYHNLTELYFVGCPNCCVLPPLGQLCSLKKLTMRRMRMLETIGSEHGDSFLGTLFPSLECLEFHDMPCWETWHHSHGSDDYLPLLKSLVIGDCPRLRGDFPSHLRSLETIKILRCDQLASSLPRSPAICTIVICDSNKVVLHELPLSLEELRIEGRQVTSIAMTLPTYLRTLYIRNCSSVISFPEDCLPTSLKSLYISDCRNLDFPKQNHPQESLKYLSINKSCESLTTLPLETLPNLYSLEIRNCENMKSFSVSKILQNLVNIAISDCPKFVSFPRGGLFAPNLISLYVSQCVNLKSLPCHVSTLLPKLQTVSVRNCPEIEMFPTGGMPPSLRTLRVVNCGKLLRSPSLTLMDMVTDLHIEGPCDGIDSFPNEGFALLPPSLISLEIRRMSSLHTVECNGLLHLTSLQQLAIRDCSKLENMVGERLISSSIKIQIYKCPQLKERSCMKRPQNSPHMGH